jgi:hypothetical protein
VIKIKISNRLIPAIIVVGVLVSLVGSSGLFPATASAAIFECNINSATSPTGEICKAPLMAPSFDGTGAVTVTYKDSSPNVENPPAVTVWLSVGNDLSWIFNYLSNGSAVSTSNTDFTGGVVLVKAAPTSNYSGVPLVVSIDVSQAGPFHAVEVKTKY